VNTGGGVNTGEHVEEGAGPTGITQYYCFPLILAIKSINLCSR